MNSYFWLQAILSIGITLVFYVIFYLLYQKRPLALLHPNIITMTLLIILIPLLRIPYEWYDAGGKIISQFLGPTVVILAVPLYETLNLLFKNMRIILLASLTSITMAFTSAFFLGKLLNVPKDLFMSIIPRSITTPMALEASNILGAIPSITVMSVILTGITGAVLGGWLSKLFKINNPFALGCAYGTSSHVIGTTQALEKGPLVGSVSAICIPITGIMTILFIPVFNWLISSFY